MPKLVALNAHELQIVGGGNGSQAEKIGKQLGNIATATTYIIGMCYQYPSIRNEIVNGNACNAGLDLILSNIAVTFCSAVVRDVVRTAVNCIAAVTVDDDL